jgi:hypothetical protein
VDDVERCDEVKGVAGSADGVGVCAGARKGMTLAMWGPGMGGWVEGEGSAKG